MQIARFAHVYARLTRLAFQPLLPLVPLVLVLPQPLWLVLALAETAPPTVGRLILAEEPNSTGGGDAKLMMPGRDAGPSHKGRSVRLEVIYILSCTARSIYLNKHTSETAHFVCPCFHMRAILAQKGEQGR